MTRPFEVGDIVRDRRLDGLLAEWCESQVGLYVVVDTAWSYGPAGDDTTLRQRVRIRRVGAERGRAGADEWATAFQRSFEMVQPVEERLARELMR